MVAATQNASCCMRVQTHHCNASTEWMVAATQNASCCMRVHSHHCTAGTEEECMDGHRHTERVRVHRLEGAAFVPDVDVVVSDGC